jgi:TldD protein
VAKLIQMTIAVVTAACTILAPLIWMPRSEAAASVASGSLSNSQQILDAMQQELDRNFQILKKSNPPVYFMAYRLSTSEASEASATDGALLTLTPVKSTGYLQIEVRVGSPQLDNFHPTKSHPSRGNDDRFVGMNVVPMDGDVSRNVLKRNLWMETEKAYRQASAQFGQVLAEQGLSTEEDKCADFSREEPVIHSVLFKPEPADPKAVADNLKALSKIYMRYPSLEATYVSQRMDNQRRFMVNTEGTRVADGKTSIFFSTYASATTADGDRVARSETMSFGSLKQAQAAQSRLEEIVNQVASSANALRTAPLAEPFCGPAMLNGTAAAVLFHEMLGHRLEASRHRKLADGKTFAKMLNHQILPPFISVYDRPLLPDMNGAPLVGHYLIDDEGVKAQNVTLVKDGKLVGFLLDRTPVPAFASSNGHGRSDGREGNLPKSRMGNLIVESSNSVSEPELRLLLIAEAKKQSKPYGLLIERVESGLTYTSSQLGQLFQVHPSVVKRVYVDGRPDELVRGVRIVGTPLSSLQRIVRTGDTTEVFNGSCGADSGWVPQANCSPALLIDYLETERQPPIKGIGKVLPPPPSENTERETHAK